MFNQAAKKNPTFSTSDNGLVIEYDDVEQLLCNPFSFNVICRVYLVFGMTSEGTPGQLFVFLTWCFFKCYDLVVLYVETEDLRRF